MCEHIHILHFRALSSPQELWRYGFFQTSFTLFYAHFLQHLYKSGDQVFQFSNLTFFHFSLAYYFHVFSLFQMAFSTEPWDFDVFGESCP